MTSQQFTNVLNEPGLLKDQNRETISGLVSRYPYCQSGHLLFAFYLNISDDPKYHDQLKLAAAYAGDRRVLRELISMAKEVSSVSKEPATMIPAVQSQEQVVDTRQMNSPDGEMPATGAEVVIRQFESTLLPYDRMTQEELLAVVKRRLAEIAAESQVHPGTVPHVENTQSTGSSDRLTAAENKTISFKQTNAPLSKESLINKFIQDEPRISKPKAAFFSPSESAFRSNLDEEEIVSETLAQLYAQQGNIQKAIHIYEKLSLINQEKCRYFAAQIQKLST